MFKMETLHRHLYLPMIVLSGLTLGCADTVEIPSVITCGALFTFEPGSPRPLVVPVGGSERLRVELRDVDRTRDGYEGCPALGHAWRDLIGWTVLDPSVARVEKYSAGVATVTGLAVGATRIRVRYGVLDETSMFVRLEVVEP